MSIIIIFSFSRRQGGVLVSKNYYDFTLICAKKLGTTVLRTTKILLGLNQNNYFDILLL